MAKNQNFWSVTERKNARAMYDELRLQYRAESDSEVNQRQQLPKFCIEAAGGLVLPKDGAMTFKNYKLCFVMQSMTKFSTDRKMAKVAQQYSEAYDALIKSLCFLSTAIVVDAIHHGDYLNDCIPQDGKYHMHLSPSALPLTIQQNERLELMQFSCEQFKKYNFVWQHYLATQPVRNSIKARKTGSKNKGIERPSRQKPLRPIIIAAMRQERLSDEKIQFQELLEIWEGDANSDSFNMHVDGENYTFDSDINGLSITETYTYTALYKMFSDAKPTV